MSATQTLLARAVPELPVADVEAAQAYYRDVLGFTVAWLDGDKGIGAVSRGECAIFFRRRSPPFEPCIHWIFSPDVAAAHAELVASGARIVEPLADKPWGLTQFTLEDPDGHRFYVHCETKQP